MNYLDIVRKLKHSIFIIPDGSDNSSLTINCNFSQLPKYIDIIQIHLIYYPYIRSINAQHVSFRPYDSYINDAQIGKKTVYEKQNQWFAGFFGIILGLMFIIVFSLVNPSELSTIEGIVSIIGLYVIGKELWNELQSFLESLTAKHKVRVYPQQFSFQRLDETSLSQYQQLARFRRYGILHPLPTHIDSIQQSNSHHIKLQYSSKEFLSSQHNSLRLLRIQSTINKDSLNLLHSMISIKLVLIKSFIFWYDAVEIIQARDPNNIFAIDNKGVFHADSLVVQKTTYIGKIKIYRTQYVIQDTSILLVEND